MNKKKIIMWVAIAFVAFWIIGNPVGAAGTVNGGFDQLGTAAGSVQTFMANVLQ